MNKNSPSDDPDEPWRCSWDKISDMPGGGQGKTAKVRNKIDRREGVAKTLKRKRSKTDRQRFAREVGALQRLHSAGCKVPKVLDSNLDSFNDLSTTPYLVMEFIEGQTLGNFIKKHGSLGFNDACLFALDLTDSIRRAHLVDSIHRDLKPQNIIVRSSNPPDLVIVDFGLSFTHGEDDDITRIGETVDNRFLRLPEGGTEEGLKRDPRSDITALCALFLYSMTGKPIGHLLDHSEKPPHYRMPRDFFERIVDHSKIAPLYSFFDRGFQHNIENRFQDIDEFAEQLNLIIKPRNDFNAPVDLAQLAQMSSQRLRATNKSTKVAFLEALTRRVSSGMLEGRERLGKDLGDYTLQESTVSGKTFEFNIPQVEKLRTSFSNQIIHRFSKHTTTVSYAFGHKGNHVLVFRRKFKPDPNTGKNWKAISDWELVTNLGSQDEQELSSVLKQLLFDLNQSVADSILVLEQDLNEVAKTKEEPKQPLKSLEIASSLKNDLARKHHSDSFLTSMDGVESAKLLVQQLFIRTNSILDDSRSHLPNLPILCSYTDNQLVTTIRENIGYSMEIVWQQTYANSLRNAELVVSFVQGSIALPGEGPVFFMHEAKRIGRQTYSPDIGDSSAPVWCSRNSESLSSEELADVLVSDFLNGLKKRVMNA